MRFARFLPSALLVGVIALAVTVPAVGADDRDLGSVDETAVDGRAESF